MDKLHKKSSTKETKKSCQLIEERVREIVREEMRQYGHGIKEISSLPYDLADLEKLNGEMAIR